MKSRTLVLLLLLTGFSATAQYNSQLLYNTHFGAPRSFDVPSELGTDIKTFDVTLPTSMHLYFGNTSFSAQNIYNIATVAQDGGDEGLLAAYALQQVSENMRDVNYINAGVNSYPLMISYKARKDGKELATFSFSTRIVGGASFFFGRGPFDLIYQGNGAFAGEDKEIGNIGLNLNAYYELGLGAAFPIITLGELVDLRGGFRVKLLNGLGAVYTPRSSITINTAPDGSEVNLQMDYLVNVAGVNNDDFDPNSQSVNGRGLGIDIGVTGRIMEKFKVSLAINDIGGINYNQNVTNWEAQGNFNWSGLSVDFDSLETALDIEPDTFLNDFNFQQSKNAFRMPIGTRLVFNASAGFNAKEKKDVEFYRHNVYLTYIQGFNRMPGNTTVPFVNAAYAANFGNILTLGTNVGYGGLYGFNMGTFMSLNLWVVRLGIGTNSLLGLVVPSQARGLDLCLNASIAF